MATGVSQTDRTIIGVDDTGPNTEQIIGMLKEQEAGAKTADVCRKHGISSAAFYKFTSRVRRNNRNGNPGRLRPEMKPWPFS